MPETKTLTIEEIAMCVVEIKISQLNLNDGAETSVDHLVDALVDGDFENNQLEDLMISAAIDAVEGYRTQLCRQLATSEPISGVRFFKTPSLSQLIDAYAAYDGEVDTFLHTWESYLRGEDFPCPDSPDGIHYVTSGSCDMCGDKNRG